MNVAFTIVGDPFAQWVKTVIQERNAKRAVESQMNLEIDPDVLAVFQNSTAVSSKFLLLTLCDLLLNV